MRELLFRKSFIIQFKHLADRLRVRCGRKFSLAVALALSPMLTPLIGFGQHDRFMTSSLPDLPLGVSEHQTLAGALNEAIHSEAMSRRYARRLGAAVPARFRVLAVPPVKWIGGCSPTSAAMVLAHWNMRGFPDLFENEGHNYYQLQPHTYRTDIHRLFPNEALVASQAYFLDYYYPADYQGAIMPDKSELSVAHPHNVSPSCLASHMKSSQSVEKLRAGQTWSDAFPRIMTYLPTQRNPTYRASTVAHLFMMETDQGHNYQIARDGQASIVQSRAVDMEEIWSLIREEIDHGRPLVVGVNSETTHWYLDHNSVVSGYAELDGVRMIAVLDTWQAKARWVPFRRQNPDNPREVFGVGQVIATQMAKDRPFNASDFETGIVHCFRNPRTGAYFFSAFADEVASMANNRNWVHLGPWFRAELGTTTENRAETPVHRFRNLLAHSYFYTACPREKQSVIDNLSFQYSYEGVAFFAATAPTVCDLAQSSNLHPYAPSHSVNIAVHRAYQPRTASHYFTTDLEEVRFLKEHANPSEIVYEGIAWYTSTLWK